MVGPGLQLELGDSLSLLLGLLRAPGATVLGSTCLDLLSFRLTCLSHRSQLLFAMCGLLLPLDVTFFPHHLTFV